MLFIDVHKVSTAWLSEVLKYIFFLFFNSLIYVCISVESGNWDCKYCKHDMVVWWTLIHMVFFFKTYLSNNLFIRSSNRSWIYQSSIYFQKTSFVYFEIGFFNNNLCLFWFSNKNKFWADQNKQQISWNKCRIGRFRIGFWMWWISKCIILQRIFILNCLACQIFLWRYVVT